MDPKKRWAWIAVIASVALIVGGIGFWSLGKSSKVTPEATPVSGAGASPSTIKYVMFFVGDGMGPSQVLISDYFAQELTGKPLVLKSEYRASGTSSTHSQSTYVTDSAAAATALFSGYKTKNGALNILLDGSEAYTIGQAFKDAGRAVGIVSTARITHATPAGVFAHVTNRNEENKIADQLLAFEPEVALGGGLRHFIPKSEKGSKREDETDLVQRFLGKGNAVVRTKDDLAKAVADANTNKLFGLFSMSHMANEIDRKNVPDYAHEPSLAEMTKAAIDVLSRSPNGLFLMVEAGRIDHAAHAHDPRSVVEDTIALDEALQVALEFYNTHPNETLIVVTGDHETGGMGMGFKNQYAMRVHAHKPVVASIEQFNKEFEAKKEEGNGQVDPEWVIAWAKEKWGFELSDEEKAILNEQLNDPEKNEAVYKESAKMVRNVAHLVLTNAISERAGIGWTSYVHTAVPVINYVKAPESVATVFAGFYDNTELPRKITQVAGVKLQPPKPVQAQDVPPAKAS